MGEAEPMRLLLVSVALTCCGCGAFDARAPLSNEELVKRAKICQDAGLDIHVVRKSQDFGGTVLDFQCVPKGDR